MSGQIELVDLISGLRTELAKAYIEGINADINFEVGPVEVEVTVSASKRGTGKAGVQFFVVTSEATGELANSTTQRIKLTLTPGATQQSSTGKAEKMKRIRGPLTISGEQMPNEH